MLQTVALQLLLCRQPLDGLLSVWSHHRIIFRGSDVTTTTAAVVDDTTTTATTTTTAVVVIAPTPVMMMMLFLLLMMMAPSIRSGGGRQRHELVDNKGLPPKGRGPLKGVQVF